MANFPLVFPLAVIVELKLVTVFSKNILCAYAIKLRYRWANPGMDLRSIIIGFANSSHYDEDMVKVENLGQNTHRL